MASAQPPLAARATELRASGDTSPDQVLESFISWANDTGISLYPAQEEALLELAADANVILATPTGSGKSLVATGAHFLALVAGKKSVYTAPIKALVSEKFFALCAVFGASNVGMATGDAAVNPDAPIICCTAEVLANKALRTGPEADLGVVVMDEFHFYGEADRGWAWQIPLLELTSSQFLLMSATLGNVDDLAADISRRTGRSTAHVTSAERPVPLHHYYATTPVHETIAELLETKQAPIYIVHFTQAAALERAQALMSINVCSRTEKDAIAELIGDFRFSAGFGKTLSRLVRHGIGVHHAGMLPKYRRLVEQLAQAGLLKVVCGTDTLGVGINVPIRTVLLTSLSKYDGQRTRHLKAREFHQIAGRAGRAGFDTAGTVVVQAPDHEVDNLRALAKAGDDEKKRRKVVRKKAPDGFVAWTEKTHDRLVAAEPEALTSHLVVTHAMVLNVIARPGNAFETMYRIISDNHEPPGRRAKHVKAAIAAYRSLVNGGLVERLPDPDEDGRVVRLTVDVPDNFALNQPLSMFAVAAMDVLDPESETFALDVISVVEATMEDPRPLLMAQQFKARGEAVAAMKAEGIDYDERMELLDEVTWPRPLAEVLEVAFNAYRLTHPWVNDCELKPKSVVRDMWERAMSFGEVVSFYGLSRAEGTVLRYLSDAYRALRSSVPAQAHSEQFDDIVEWLGETIRQTDSSLLDEWENLIHPGDNPDAAVALPAKPRPLSANTRALTALIRNALFRRVELAARENYRALGELDGHAGWSADRWQEALDDYFDEHEDIGIGPDARGPQLLLITHSPGIWHVRQIFDDPAGDHDWGISAKVDLAASDETGAAVITITDVNRL